jgi:PAS domain S-box-containing protein
MRGAVEPALVVLRQVKCRVGRRGYSLLVFALVDFVYGSAMAWPNAETRSIALFAYAGTLAPLRVWGAVWIGVGVVCLVQAFMRRDQFGFTAAISIKVTWALLATLGWLTSELPRGHLSAAIWCTFAGLVAVIGSWPEPSPRFATVAEALISADGRGRIVAWNSAAARMFGWTAIEVLGKPLEIVVPPELRARHREGFTRAAEQNRSDLAGRVLAFDAMRRDGRRFAVELTISVWTAATGDEGVNFTGLVRDVSRLGPR